jgi:hypothetical protein
MSAVLVSEGKHVSDAFTGSIIDRRTRPKYVSFD